ncbi:hypothetical protein PCASD_14689 [Puccinia coronata f. sp. avenae]|uniref:Uncharacterized protein n=1 Tax=Puccinia coronata f. sp. avenae TaxID=200324 RepID=A0A2N5TEC2_9BASI|nr:hypothetical protein PCASD_14689 [Puccinia coronata f. sp. avenae]
MAQRPTRCPRLDGGVNYGHFDPECAPSNHRRGPIAWDDCRLGDQSCLAADQAWQLIKLGFRSPSSSVISQYERFHQPAALNHKGPIIKKEPGMSNQPTNENAPREVHLDFLLYANQQILMDRPSHLEYGKIGCDKLTPREFIPPMEINLDGLTAGEFKTAVSNHLNVHCRYLPVWLIVEEAEEAGAIEWTYRIRDRVALDSDFTKENRFSGHGHKGFADFLVAARASSRMARMHVDLCMARPLPDEMAPSSPASDMEEDQLATSPPRPSLPTKATAANRIPRWTTTTCQCQIFSASARFHPPTVTSGSFLGDTRYTTGPPSRTSQSLT